MKYFNLPIEDIITETSDTKTFILAKPRGFNHFPGQFSWLSLPSLTSSSQPFPRTPMAIASGIHEKHLIFTFRSWGYLTDKLFTSRIGDEFTVSQPLGTSIPLDLFNTKRVICIGGGTGITPIRSLFLSINSDTPFKLFYGARTPFDIVYKNKLSEWNSSIIVERAENSPTWSGPLGFVTKLLTNDLFHKDNICYICGPFPMMQNVVSSLRKIGFQPENLYVSLEKLENDEVIGPVFPVSDPNVVF